MASEIKSGAILNYASIVVRLATSFLLTPFVIATLGVVEYGLFMLVCPHRHDLNRVDMNISILIK